MFKQEIDEMLGQVYGNDEFAKSMLLLRVKTNCDYTAGIMAKFQRAENFTMREALIYQRGNDDAFYTYVMKRPLWLRAKDLYELIKFELGLTRRIRILGHKSHYLLLSKNYITVTEHSKLCAAKKDLRQKEREHGTRKTEAKTTANA